MTNIYGGIDPRDIPSYSISDAARYLRIPRGTIRAWTVGRRYRITSGSNFFKPLIPIHNRRPRLLSFTNLIEVHVLRAIRKQHKIDLYKGNKLMFTQNLLWCGLEARTIFILVGFRSSTQPTLS
ncbi:hypothetical protein [Scytonema sp. NUACC26]|uniref:hypothetical protein n=1 Tax=Scytonema sp. NUACC26 TaxID=3140176 RepID=UPI0034DC6A1F